jgi:SAM-dependent methyltransferase
MEFSALSLSAIHFFFSCDYAERMPMMKIVRDARNVLIARAASGGSQNFLGARWVEHLVGTSPATSRERVALRLLSLSPHYFYDRDICSEAERNRRSRAALVDVLIKPHLTQRARVLDYGCGPGYMAHAVAEEAYHVDAVDISRGVLACAKVLNGRPNISYQTPDELRQGRTIVDLAYSFAVVQHLRSEVLAEALSLLARKIHSDGVLLLHFAVPGQGGWRTEAEWKADKSVAGRARLRYSLNCFGRSTSEMEHMVLTSGFADVIIRPLSGTVTVPGCDDVTQQHWLTARRK